MHITITDDGCGFNYGQFEEDTDNHFGLVFMRERMAHVGGSLEIDSKAIEGTTVNLAMPLRESLEEPR
jgi:nitrate/nitrite-specific signal transduction histidine kinase